MKNKLISNGRHHNSLHRNEKNHLILKKNYTNKFNRKSGQLPRHKQLMKKTELRRKRTPEQIYNDELANND